MVSQYLYDVVIEIENILKAYTSVPIFVGKFEEDNRRYPLYEIVPMNTTPYPSYNQVPKIKAVLCYVDIRYTHKDTKLTEATKKVLTELATLETKLRENPTLNGKVINYDGDYSISFEYFKDKKYFTVTGILNANWLIEYAIP